MKTASELALKYWNKLPIERVNNTLQDHVYDYMVSILNVEKIKIEMAKDYLSNTNHKYFHFKHELSNILTSGTYYKIEEQ
ncbi:MAG: hypothetical protein RR623_00925 [Bacilli bacterium]